MKLLLVGVGGVGCEFLILLSEIIKADKLTSCDIKITIIDNDTVEESNLSRQRLFSLDDIGRSKVDAAVEKLKNDLTINSVNAKLEDIDDAEFFDHFNVFVLAVDNLETRRWMNSVLKNYRKIHDDWLLLDMGVEGFKFSLRTVRSGTACLECTMSFYTGDEGVNVPVCSIYGRPRDLKDCVYWSLSRNNFDNLRMIYDSTRERSKEFGIDSSELSFEYIEGLMKRTIPAVASVNSLLAAKGLEIIFRKDWDDFNFWMINLECGYYELRSWLEVSEDCMFCNEK